jgi:hypothetical protein
MTGSLSGQRVGSILYSKERSTPQPGGKTVTRHCGSHNMKRGSKALQRGGGMLERTARLPGLPFAATLLLALALRCADVCEFSWF